MSAEQIKMSCDRCSVNFTFFKRKKCCQECHRYFCSTCLPKPHSSSTVGRQCSKCRLLVSGHFSRDDLQDWKVNDIRCFLNVRNISTKDCREKHDLIELVLARFCTRPQQSVQEQVEHEILVQQMAAHVRNISFASESSSTGTSGENSPASQRNAPSQISAAVTTESTAATVQSLSSSNSVSSPPEQSPASNSAAGSSSSYNRAANQTQGEPQEIQFEINNNSLRELLESIERIQAFLTQHDSTEQSGPTEQPIRRTQLDDITEISHIGDLSVRQLKELLVNNFVDYKGCFEKAELVEKTKRLWKDYQENKIRAQVIHKQEEAAYYSIQHNKPSGSEDAVASEIFKEEMATTSASKTAEEEKEHTAEGPTDSTSADKEAASIETSKPVPAAPATSSSGEFSAQRSDSLCHICMDSLIDCILLECGHMVTCTQCGKRLADCPICRQYIVRVVRVFRP